MRIQKHKLSKLPVAILAVTFLCLNVLAIHQPARAQTIAATEKEKIEKLITAVGVLKDAQFVRNGSTYSAANAATFLRRKWQANEAKVKSARDFIDNVASYSGTSGKPYLIRFKNGQETKSHDYLAAELHKIEATSPAASG